MVKVSELAIGVFIATANLENLITLRDLVEAGKVTLVIDKYHPLSETPETVRYLGEGHARGKVVIIVK